MGCLIYKKLDKESRIIFYLVILASVPQTLTDIIGNSLLHFIYNVYTAIEFFLIYIFIGNKMQRRIFRNISTVIAVAFILLSLFIFIFYGWNHGFLNEWVCAANICYLSWILLFILESLENEKKLLNVHDPLFWHLSALLIYTPCTMFVFALSSYINKSQNPFINKLWIIHGVFNTLLYLFFAIGFFKAGVNMGHRTKAIST